MKKSSLITKASSRRTSRNKVFARIVVGGLVVSLLVIFVPKLVTSIAHVFLTPIHVTESWLLNSKDSLPYFFRDRKELVSEIRQLKSKPPETVEDKLIINRLQKENSELRTLLNDDTEERIVAGVIGRPNVVPYDVLVIDKGEVDGIMVGAPVFVGSDAVIGVVESVASHSSVVELVTSPAFEATVFIYGPDIYTTAVGVGGGVLRVGVPQGIVLSEGDVVVLPSVESGVFGGIVAVESLSTQPEQYGFVTPNIPINSLRLVAVGSRPLSPTTFAEAQSMVDRTYESLFTVPVPEDILIDLTATSTATITDSVIVGVESVTKPVEETDEE